MGIGYDLIMIIVMMLKLVVLMMMIIYLNIGDGSDHDREDFHMFQIFLPSDMFLQMLLHPSHMC